MCHVSHESFVLLQSVRAAVLVNPYAIDRYTVLKNGIVVNPRVLRQD
jgi:hypothetical protein